MALPNRNTPSANTAAGFEDPDAPDTGAEVSGTDRLAAAAAERARAAAETATPAKTTAVATQGAKAGQVAVAKPMTNPLAPLKDAFPVEFDTLRNVIITNGNVMDRESNKPFGDTVGLELLSFQDQYVVSPGVDGDEAKEHVRYSNDGITTTKGDDVKQYLETLKTLGYDNAAVSQRMVICGALFDIGTKGKKDLADLQDGLVQMSLPPTSKANFNRYMMDQAYKIGKGVIEPEGAQRLKISCELVTRGKNTWTQANFSRYDA